MNSKIVKKAVYENLKRDFDIIKKDHEEIKGKMEKKIQEENDSHQIEIKEISQEMEITRKKLKANVS